MSRLADISVAIQEWAVSRLLASQELADALAIPLNQVGVRVWDSPPGSDAALPYVLVNVVEPRDVGGVGMAEVMATALLDVKVVGRAESYEEVRDAAVAIHQALQGRTNDPISGGGTMLSSRRLRVISYPEQTQGVEYRHLGGTYTVSAQ